MEEKIVLPKWVEEIIDLVASTNYEKTWASERISVTPVLMNPDDEYGGRWKVILQNGGFTTVFLWKLVDISRKYKLDIHLSAEPVRYRDENIGMVRITLVDSILAPKREELDRELMKKLEKLGGGE